MTERMLSAGKSAMDASSKTLGTVASGTVMAAGKTVSTMKKVKRHAKETTSSALEKLLLRATFPDDAPVAPIDAKDLVSSIRSYPLKQSRREVNAYEKLLHKVWKKALEPDWRTTLKGLSLLHYLAKHVRPREGRRIVDCIKSMKRSRYTMGSVKSKPLKHRYFSTKDMIVTLDRSGIPYADFLKAYMVYVMKRTSYSARFEELQEVIKANNEDDAAPSVKVDEAVQRIDDAKEMVSLALKIECIVAPRKSDESDTMVARPNFVIGSVEFMVKEDLMELWKKLTKVVMRCIEGSDPVLLPAEERIRIMEWWLVTRPKVEDWLDRCRKSIHGAGIKTDASRFSLESLEEALNLTEEAVTAALEAATGESDAAEAPEGGAAPAPAADAGSDDQVCEAEADDEEESADDADVVDEDMSEESEEEEDEDDEDEDEDDYDEEDDDY